MTSYVDVAREGRVTTITIDRAESYNALNAAAQREMAAAMDGFASDDDQWIAIVTGAGEKAFCAGHDLKQQASGGGMETPSSGFGGLTARFDCPKPIIAAINGVAMGGGFEVALACDIVIAARHAIFAMPEPRVGLAAMAGGLHRLPRAIGLTRAMGILLTGRRVSAAEGFELGFVNEVAEGDVMTTARAWADRMLECGPLALRATKQGVHAGLDCSFADALRQQWGLSELRAMLSSLDAVEGPAAFAEKRRPNWSGR